MIVPKGVPIKEILACFRNIYSLYCHEDHFSRTQISHKNIGHLQINVNDRYPNKRGCAMVFPWSICSLTNLTKLIIIEYSIKVYEINLKYHPNLEQIAYKIGRCHMKQSNVFPRFRLVKNAPASLK